MNVLMIVTLVLAIPVVLLPVLLIWYINIGGMRLVIREAKTKVKQGILNAS